MHFRDERILIAVFLTIGILLGGILLRNLYSHDSPDPVLWSVKKADFKQQFPRTLLETGADWHFEALRESSHGLPEIIFTIPYGQNISLYTDSVKQKLRAKFEILDELQEDDIAVFGVGYDERPVGKFILQQDLVPKRVTVAIIIDDFGYSDNSVVTGFLHLPPKLTYAIIPGHHYSKRIGRMAADHGFEVMIHMPMEPEDYAGGEKDYILKPSMNQVQIATRIHKAISQLPMATGMNNHQGSLASQDPKLMTAVLQTLDQNGMFFVDSKTVSESVGDSLAQVLGVPHGVRRVFLDNEQDTTYIKKQLKELVDHAIRGGKVIGIGHDKRKTLEVLKEYIPYYEARGIRFARVSDVLTYPEPVM